MVACHSLKVFQPTRPLRGATCRLRRGNRPPQISTHAPLAGRDDPQLSSNAGTAGFQPTRPLRGATVLHHAVKRHADISTHAPLAGRDLTLTPVHRAVVISTHAPLAGRDTNAAVSEPEADVFQPTRPLRGATSEYLDIVQVEPISTHAPLAGRDSKSVQINMHIFAITDKFQMLLHRMPPVRAFCSFLMQENHADLGANRPSDLCALVLRTIRSSVPRADTSACSRSVRFYSRTSCPSSKIEGCPFLGQ